MSALADFFEYEEVTLRRITDRDIPATVAMINEAYSYAEPTMGVPRTNPDSLRERVGESEFFVAMRGRELVGCCYVRPMGGAMHVGLLTVSKPMRGAGLGTAMVVASERYTSTVGLERLELDYMSLMPRLRAYYERLGFRATGRSEEWLGMTLIRMDKPVDAPAPIARRTRRRSR